MALPAGSNSSLPPTFNPFKPFSPLDYFKQALGSGVAVWEKIANSDKEHFSSLLSLIFIIKAHTKSLAELCMLKGLLHQAPCEILNRLLSFYQQTEYPTSLSKRGQSLRNALQNSINPSGGTVTTNYYDALSQLVPEDDESYYPSSITMATLDSQDGKPFATSTTSDTTKGVAAVFSEDLGISAVSSFMTRNQQENSEMEEDDDQQQVSQDDPSPTTTILALDKAAYRHRLNLIRHKNTTPTDLTTLQLLKAFLLCAKKADKSLVVLPVDSTKQHLSPLLSNKQIENLTPNQMRLYLSSWFKDQHHSISGFLHFSTALTIDELQTSLPLGEWLQTFQYSIAPCKSQDEEMSLVGALCYGSLFLHRDSVLQGIQAHPRWVELNKEKEKPIVIDLIVKPFRSPGKSEDMIFVRSERSKREEVQKFFSRSLRWYPQEIPTGRYVSVHSSYFEVRG